MKCSKTIIILCVCAGVTTAALSASPQPGAPISAPEQKLVTANTRFGFKLFAELLKQDRGKNVFISPLSITLALAMTYNGAAGETQQAMARALELEGLSLQEVNLSNSTLREALARLDPKVQLTIANSLWARKGWSFKPDFIRRNQMFYGAELSELDFDKPDAAATINDWVKKSTKGRIDKLVADRIDTDTILFLINAVYFKGMWATEFDKRKTADGVFALPGGQQKKLPMMSQSGKFSYLAGNGFQAVILPYGAGRLSMYVFLPNENSNLADFCRQLDSENWAGWMGQFNKMDGDLALPRFKLEYEKSLNDALAALGMAVAFDGDRADFSAMCSVRGVIYIKDVKHKTFVEVSEEGTEAAAATKVEMAFRSMPARFRMVVNRPFFCAIRDNQSGAVLFMGSIVDPQ